MGEPWPEQLKVACPVCLARKGVPCVDQTEEDARRGQGFHGGRVVAAVKTRHPTPREHAGGQETTTVDDNRHEMAELWRYAHDPDLLAADVARWAYDRIIGLEHALAAVTGWPLPTGPDRTGDQHTGTQLPILGRGWGKTAAQDEIVDAALRRGESVDRVGPDGVEERRPRWRTGRSVRPRVTLYRDDQIAGLALTAELAAEIVERCNESTMTEMPPCYIDADAGECATERAVVEALMDVGPWDEIDGDGDPGSILADHIRQLPRIIRDECEG